MPKRLYSVLGPQSSVLLLLFLAGCNILGFAASAATGGQQVDARYKGLAGQKCAVMVWADDGVLNDFKTIQLDTANGIQHKMQEGAKANISDVANMTWVSPEQVMQFQQNHTDVDTDAVEDIAPQLGVSRLIYVEIDSFATHPNDSPDLARGSMSATIKVVEVKDGVGKVAYSERGVNVISPKDCPVEGLPNLDDQTIYQGTVDSFTTAAAQRFMPHDEDIEDAPPMIAKE
jgi:hypothetical protein